MITAIELSTCRNVRHGFFTRQGGVSQGLYASLNCGLGSGDDISAVKLNRSAASSQLSVEGDRLVTLYQCHSSEVVAVEKPWAADKRPKADALVTATPGLAIGVLTADCGPVLFAEPIAAVIGAAHAGWKGALTGVVENTVESMERLGAKRERIVAVVGPAISQENYEVGPDFMTRFAEKGEDSNRWFKPAARQYHAMFNLPDYIFSQLQRSGVGTIVCMPLCTYDDEERFFSFRRATHRGEKDYGRQLSAIALSA